MPEVRNIPESSPIEPALLMLLVHLTASSPVLNFVAPGSPQNLSATRPLPSLKGQRASGGGGTE